MPQPVRSRRNPQMAFDAAPDDDAMKRVFEFLADELSDEDQATLRNMLAEDDEEPEAMDEPLNEPGKTKVGATAAERVPRRARRSRAAGRIPRGTAEKITPSAISLMVPSPPAARISSAPSAMCRRAEWSRRCRAPQSARAVSRDRIHGGSRPPATGA